MNVNNKKQLPKLSVQFLGLISAFTGIIALLGWILTFPPLTTFGSGFIPMAPSTAVLFLLLGSVIYLHSQFPENRRIFLWGIGISAVCIFVSFVLLLLSSQGVFWGVEHTGFTIEQAPGNIPIGHMSPVTAFGFVLIGVSLIMTLQSSKQPKLVILSFSISCFVIFSISVLFLAYLLENPVFYGGNIIPPALPSRAVISWSGTRRSITRMA